MLRRLEEKWYMYIFCLILYLYLVVFDKLVDTQMWEILEFRLMIVQNNI